MKTTYKVLAVLALVVLTTAIASYTSYREGVKPDRDIMNSVRMLQFEYIKAPADQKTEIRNLILHRCASYKTEEMPQDIAPQVQKFRRQFDTNPALATGEKQRP